MTIADEGTTVSVSNVPISGSLRGVYVSAPELTGISYTISITDKYGNTVFTRTI